MEIITEPQFLERDVLQIDFCFLGKPAPYPVTLQTTDKVTVTADTIVLDVTNPETGYHEVITVERRNLLFHTTATTKVRYRNPKYKDPRGEQATDAAVGTPLAWPPVNPEP